MKATGKSPSKLIQKNAPLIIFLFIVGAYLDIPLIVSSSIPSIPSIANIILVFILFPYLKSSYTKHDVALIFKVLILVIFTIVFSSNLLELPNRMFKILQYLFSIVSFTLILKIFILIDISKLKKIFISFLLFFLIGVFLEYIGLIKPLSDAFRSVVFKGGSYGLYNAEDRDIFMAGFVRPNLFTTEPSLVAIAFFIFTVCFLLLAKKLSSFLLIAIFSLLFYLVCASPITLLNFIVLIIIFIYKNKKSKKVFISLISLFLFISLSFSLFPSISASIQERLINDITNENQSTYTRLYVPYVEAIPAALTYNPLLGVGFGSRKLLSEITGNAGADISLTDSRDMEYIEGSNAFARIIIYQGILGLILTLFFIKKYLINNYSLKNYLLLVLIFIIYSQTSGSYESPRFWTYFALIVGSLLVFEKSKSAKIINAPTAI